MVIPFGTGSTEFRYWSARKEGIPCRWSFRRTRKVAGVGLSLKNAMEDDHRSRRSCTLYREEYGQPAGVRGHHVHQSLARPADKQSGHIIEFRYQRLYGVSPKRGRAKVVGALVTCTTIAMDVDQYKLNTSTPVPTAVSIS